MTYNFSDGVGRQWNSLVCAPVTKSISHSRTLLIFPSILFAAFTCSLEQWFATFYISWLSCEDDSVQKQIQNQLKDM